MPAAFRASAVGAITPWRHTFESVYDDLSRQIARTVRDENQALVAAKSYTYDPASNMLSASAAGATVQITTTRPAT